MQPEEVFRKASPAVWTVKGDQGGDKTSVGSTVAVTPAALVTACHVVNGAMKWRELLQNVGVALGPNGEPAPSGHADLADEAGLPVIGTDPAQIRVAYRQFLLQARPRAFLITGDNKFGTATNSAALTEHLKGCAERKVVCAAYAVDDTVVWGKQQPTKSTTN